MAQTVNLTPEDRDLIVQIYQESGRQKLMVEALVDLGYGTETSWTLSGEVITELHEDALGSPEQYR